jgi:hypothetical protein
LTVGEVADYKEQNYQLKIQFNMCTEHSNTNENGNYANRVLCTVVITEDDMKALIRIRNYFGENDKTQLEHLAFDVLDRVVKPFLNNGA